MLTRLAGASVRAALVAVTVAIPAVMLPDVSPNSAELSILLAAIAAAFVIFEYGFASPSLIEFRFAAPYNRLRFGILAVLVVLLVFAFRGPVDTTAGVLAVSTFAQASFEFWNFSYSPLQAFMALSATTGPQNQILLGNASALALSVTTLGVLLPGAVVWTFGWPLGRDNFNIWINMPTFDVGGSNAAANLRRTAIMSAAFGFAFPFLAPYVALSFLGPLGAISANNSQFLVWTIAIWCFVPAASMLRAIALFKIASLIGNDQEEPT